MSKISKQKTVHAHLKESKKQRSKVAPTVDEILEGVNLKRNQFGEIYFIDTDTIALGINQTQRLVLKEYGGYYTDPRGSNGIWKLTS